VATLGVHVSLDPHLLTLLSVGPCPSVHSQVPGRRQAPGQGWYVGTGLEVEVAYSGLAHWPLCPRLAALALRDGSPLHSRGQETWSGRVAAVFPWYLVKEPRLKFR
jgi:hypothetical protein